MPVEMKALKGMDKQVVIYTAVLVLALAGTVVMTWHLGVLRADFAVNENTLAQKEQEASGIALPTDQERGQWMTQQNLMASRLLVDAQVPVFFQDISRLFNLNQLLRFDLKSQEYVVNEGADLSDHDMLMQAVGIRRYDVITLEFSGRYRNISQFIQAVGQLPRLSEFVTIQLRRNTPMVDVTMTFRVYKSEAAD